MFIIVHVSVVSWVLKVAFIVWLLGFLMVTLTIPFQADDDILCFLMNGEF